MKKDESCTAEESVVKRRKVTVLVVYTNLTSISTKSLGQHKKYSFNSSDGLKEGDVITSPDYTTNMLVVKVLDKKFKYYNKMTGKMSNTFNSTSQWKIRRLIIRNQETDAVYGSIIPPNHN